MIVYRQLDNTFSVESEVSMKTIDFGLNTDKYDGDKWNTLVEAFRQAVEADGEASANWDCQGRTRHYSNAKMLEEALPQYKFDISYEHYKCVAKK